MPTGSPWCVPLSGLRCWPAVNRPGDASPLKASIMVTGSLWWWPAVTGRAIVCTSGQGFDHGRAVRARSRPRSCPRVRLGACHCQGFIHGPGVPGSVGASMRRSTGRAVRASSRPRSWPGGVCQFKTSIMVTGSPWCVPPSRLRCRRSTGQALPASSRPQSWSRVRLGGGQWSTGRVVLASVKTSIMPTGSPWCVPPSGLHSWPGCAW